MSAPFIRRLWRRVLRRTEPGSYTAVKTAAPPEWRDQTERERELIETILLADFPGRDEVALQLRGARVRDDCGCGCGSFAPEPDPGRPRAPLGGVVFESAGEDDTGNTVGLFIKVHDGQVEYIECWGMATDPSGLPRRDSLRTVAIVPQSETWSTMEPHTRTIIEEANRRGPKP